MTPTLVPLRGEVWDVRFPAPIGDHPAIVLTTNALIGRLSAVTIALVTGTAGPAQTHVVIDAEAGLTQYPVSYANATDLHTVPLARFRRRRGMLSGTELDTLSQAVRLALSL